MGLASQPTTTHNYYIIMYSFLIEYLPWYDVELAPPTFHEANLTKFLLDIMQGDLRPDMVVV